MELKGENTFKISAYKKAAQALEGSQCTLEEITDLTSLPGIGKGTASVIEEYRTEGKSTLLEEFKNRTKRIDSSFTIARIRWRKNCQAL